MQLFLKFFIQLFAIHAAFYKLGTTSFFRCYPTMHRYDAGKTAQQLEASRYLLRSGAELLNSKTLEKIWFPTFPPPPPMLH